ncbi:unnamed protein product, partial [Mesorhabditis spiculigera]
MRRGGWPIRKISQGSFDAFLGTSPAGCEWKRAIREISIEHLLDEKELLDSIMANEEVERHPDSKETNLLKKAVLHEAFTHFDMVFKDAKYEELKVGISPGRVNLIGDHVDYVDGFVLPIALPLYTVALGRPAPPGHRYTRIHASYTGEFVDLRHDIDYHQNKELVPKWARYILGIFALHKPDFPLDVVIHSNIPVGAGLSSSAAVELALYFLFDQFNKVHLTTEKVAMLCQKAEHEFAGVPCGIMDQFVCSLAHAGHALKIDCSNLAYDRIPLEITRDATFVVVDSRVKHSLAAGEYAKRRQAVEQTLQAIMGAKSWRDVTEKKLEEYYAELSHEERDCGMHVLGEIRRTEEAATALLSNNIKLFGELMWESHDSLKNLYKVSCIELDELVDIAKGCEDVWGARMTGGGFGGCIVALVKKSGVNGFKKLIEEKYSGSPHFFDGIPVNGAGTLDPNAFL